MKSSTRKYLICLAVLFTLSACSDAAEGDIDSESNVDDEGFSENQDSEQIYSVLPDVDSSDPRADCEPPFFDDGPDIDAWLAASESIVVGTIAEVELIKAPMLISHVDEEGSYWEFGEPSDCMNPDSIVYLVDLHLTDVETLFGEEKGDEVVVRLHRGNLGKWDILAHEEDDGSVNWYRYPDYLNTLFEPGARIGGSIREDEHTENLVFEFRLFEVLDDFLRLQPYSDAIEEEIISGGDCTHLPWRSMILHPDYDEMPFDQFQQEIESRSVDVEVLREINPTVERYLSILEEPSEYPGLIAYYQFLPVCVGSYFDPPSEEEPL